MDFEKIKEYYSGIEDFKLERIAKFEIADLDTQVQEIIIEEIKKRGLDSSLLDAIEIQTKELTSEEYLTVFNKIKNLNCPICQKINNGTLEAGIVRKVRSFIVFTYYSEKSLIACNPCIEKERNSNLLLNFLLGWWGFPWGLLYRTPKAIISHFLDNRKKQEISDRLINEFVNENIGEIRANWDDKDYLSDYIDHLNSI